MSEPASPCDGCELASATTGSGSHSSGEQQRGSGEQRSSSGEQRNSSGEQQSGSGYQPLPACLQRPSRRPFLIGVYLAVNAIADAALVVDGPDCAFFKAEYIHGKHDLCSTLLDVMGKHRIVVSQVTTDDIATARGERVAALIRSAGRLPHIKLTLVTSLPMVTIIGVQYDGIIRELQPELAATVAGVPGRSLQADWLGGYEDVLLALAEQLPDEPAELDDRSVSIIGHLMDRNEEDQLGNVRELHRLIEALGLELEAVWLSGAPWSELRRARRSGVLLALPLGRQAAARIAQQSGARVVAVETPFGLVHTAALLRAAGAATGRAAAAEQLIERELRAVVPRLEWAVPHFFLGKRIAFSGAPDLLGPFVELATELGLMVAELASPAQRPRWLDRDPPGQVAPRFDEPYELLLGRLRGGPGPPVDLVVGPTDLLRLLPAELPAVELGFPSYGDHAFIDRPFLGYRGYLTFVQRLATALGLKLVRTHRG